MTSMRRSTRCSARKAALDWAASPEGRECLAEQRRVLAECTPMKWDTTPFPADVEL